MKRAIDEGTVLKPQESAKEMRIAIHCKGSEIAPAMAVNGVPEAESRRRLEDQGLYGHGLVVCATAMYGSRDGEAKRGLDKWSPTRYIAPVRSF